MGALKEAGSGGKQSFFRKYFAFLDHLLGRGFFFIFIGMRVVPLGKFYCLVAGIVIFIFGFINIALHFKVKGEEGDNYSYSEICGVWKEKSQCWTNRNCAYFGVGKNLDGKVL